MIVVLDNYDSFTYNLVQLLGELGAELHVVRNDRITVDEIRAMNPQRIVISPGPGIPDDAGISVELIRSLGPQIPILGVCLGHQAIGRAYGCRVGRAPVLMHGKASHITHDGRGLYRNLPNPFLATRYHSLVIDETTLTPQLQVTARDSAGIVMGIRHREYPVEGVQFHPESILTREGERLLKNFYRTEAERRRPGDRESADPQH